MEGAPHEVTSELEALGEAAAQSEFTRRAIQFSCGDEPYSDGRLLPHLGILVACVVFGALLALAITRPAS
jgi:hypothetical protein